MRLFISMLLFTGAAMSLHADTFVYVSMAPEKSIQVYRLEPKDGALTPVETFSVEGSPGALCIDPINKYLFASLRTIDSLASYSIDVKTGKLKHVNTVLREKGGNAAHVMYDPMRNELVSASYMAGNWGTHLVGDSGKIDNKFTRRIVTAKTAHQIAFHPSAQWMFVPHVEPNAIYQYRRDKSGAWESAGQAAGGAPKAGPRHLAFHPTLKMAFSSDETGSSITAYTFDPEKGLSPVQTLSTLPADFKKGNTTAEVKVHPSGKYVWVSNRGHDSLAGFSIDANGKLAANGHAATEKTPRSFEIDPDGQWMFGAGEGSGKLAVFRVGDAGTLTRAHTVNVGKSVTWVMAVKMGS